MRKQNIILAFTILTTLMLLTGATIDTTGHQASTNSGAGSYVRITNFTASSNGNIISLGINLTNNAGNVALGIYADSGGSPTTLIANTSSFSTSVGWHYAPVLQIASLVAGHQYWLGYQATSGSLGIYTARPSGYLYYATTGGFNDWASSPSWITGGYGYGYEEAVNYSVPTTTSTTSTTTTSTTTIPPTTTTIISGGNSINAPVYGVLGVFFDIFTVPLAGYIILILAWGMSYELSKRFFIAFLLTTLVSYLLVYIQAVSFISIIVAIALTSLTMFIWIYDSKKK